MLCWVKFVSPTTTDICADNNSLGITLVVNSTSFPLTEAFQETQTSPKYSCSIFGGNFSNFNLIKPAADSAVL